MTSLLEMCSKCGGTGLGSDYESFTFIACLDCRGEGVVFTGFGDDDPLLTTAQMLDYLITDNTTSSAIERQAKALIQELTDHRIDMLADQAERQAEDR